MQHSEPGRFFNSLRRLSAALFASSFVLLAAKAHAGTSPQFTEYDIPTEKSNANDITLGADGNMWFIESDSHKVARITASGKISEFDVPTKNGLEFIQRGPKGELWFNEFATGKIWSISMSGVIQGYPVPSTVSYGLAFGSDGNMWFGSTDRDAIGRMKPDGTIAEFPLPEPRRAPAGMAAAKDQSIWFVEDYDPYGGLGRITTQGKIAEYPFHPKPPIEARTKDEIGSGFGELAIATDGNVWFTEPYLNRIARRSATGTVAEYAVPTSKSRPVNVVAGTNSDVWFTEAQGNKFGHVTAQGKITEYNIPTPSRFLGGIALDANGNVWVVENSANKILKASMPH